MTLKDLSLGFSKRPYLQRSVEMVTQGELLKFVPFSSSREKPKIHGTKFRHDEKRAKKRGAPGIELMTHPMTGMLRRFPFVAVLLVASTTAFTGPRFLSSFHQQRGQVQRPQPPLQPVQRRPGRRQGTARMVFERFSGDAVAAVMFSQQEAKRMAGSELEPEHLLLGVVSSPEGAYGALQRCKLASLSDVSRAVEEFTFAQAAEDAANAASAAPVDANNPLQGLFGGGGGGSGGAAADGKAAAGKKKADAPFSRRAQRVFPRALELSENFGSDVVRSEHLLMAVLDEGSDGGLEHPGVAAVLANLGVSPYDLLAETASDAESGTGKAELVGAGAPKGKTPTLSECGVR